MATVKEILNAGSSVQSKYMASFEELGGVVSLFKASGYKIVLTQGVYDMFHVGHGRYILEAASHGDILIIGVDSDELTKSMKGPGRPFDDFDQRIEVLAMLSAVNIIVKRDLGQDKYDLIKLVKPDVLIMSQTTRSFGEEDVENLKDFCGKIEWLEAKAAQTTTAKLRRMADEHGLETAKRIVEAMNPVLEPLGAKIQVVVNGGK
ncbi:MAG: adenylyltransferase/cytidyltransferase family protein [Candidatus Paceibacterota bacterium]